MFNNLLQSHPTITYLDNEFLYLNLHIILILSKNLTRTQSGRDQIFCATRENTSL